MRVHSRALLSSEALEQHLCVAVDAEVLDGLGILRRACRILPGSGLGERRAHGVSESLHRGYGAVTKAGLCVGSITGRRRWRSWF